MPIGRSHGLERERAAFGKETGYVTDFLIGLAFVAMVVTPALVASFQRTRSHDNDL